MNRNRFSGNQVIGFILLTGILVEALFYFDGFERLLLLAVLGGVVTGAFMFWRGKTGGDEAPLPEGPAGIRIDRIQISGGIGAGILIVLLLTAVLIGLPELRWLALPGGVAGLAFGGILIMWRKHNGE